jgi:hypothetical protein
VNPEVTAECRCTQAGHGPLTVRAIARVAFGEAAREASEYARRLVPTVGDEQVRPGETIRAARQLRLLALNLVERAIVVERRNGASWVQIADAMNLPVDLALQRYQDLPLDAEHPEDAVPICTDSTHERAAALDLWCRTTGSGDRLLAGVARPFLDDLH